MIGELALAEERLEHRGLRFLELEEERVVAVPPEQEHDEGARADAADPDDLPGRVDIAEPLEQPATVSRERSPVGADDLLQRLVKAVELVATDKILDRRHDGRVADDARLAVDELGQLRERLQAALRLRLRQVALGPLDLLRGRLLLKFGQQLLDVQARVPEVEVAHGRVPVDRLAVGTADRLVDRLSLPLVEAAVAAGDREARDEALDVPLERAGQRLVEVVDAEDEPPVRGCEAAEVGEMGIAAELGVQPRSRHRREVRRHQVCRTAVEGKRRHEHPPVADRHQLGHARLRLLLEQLDRARPVRPRLPGRVGGARKLGTRRLAARDSLGRAQMLDPPCPARLFVDLVAFRRRPGSHCAPLLARLRRPLRENRSRSTSADHAIRADARRPSITFMG